MKRKLLPSRCGLRPAFVLLPALAVWLIGCTPPPSGSSSLLPTPPEVLPDLNGRSVKVALLADRLPFSSVDPATGAASGFDYDLITTLAARLNFVPQFVAADPATLLTDLAASRFDVVGGGIAYTLPRAAQFDFTSAYGLVTRRLAVRVGDGRAATIAAFHDATALRVGTVSGTTADDMAVAFLGTARVVGFDTFAAAVDALVAADVDGVVLGDADLQREQARLPGRLVALPGPIGGDVLAYALRKGSDLTDPLDGAFLQLQAEGAIASLREKWGL